MNELPPHSSQEAPTGGWIRPVALVLACVAIGFVGGWVLRGDDGTVTVLPTGEAAITGATTPNSGTGTDAPTTTPTPKPPAPPAPPRDQIALIVLNGTNIAGFAGRTAGEAESVGYQGVIAGDAPATTDPSTVYYAAGQEPAARRAARDLKIAKVAPLPASGALRDAVNAINSQADVAVVLGP